MPAIVYLIILTHDVSELCVCQSVTAITWLEHPVVTSVSVIVGLPGKPGTPTFTDVLDTSLVLHWTAPEDDGGAEINNYVIHCRPETDADWKPATGDKISKTEHAVTKLKTDAIYQFKVAAVNKVGTGPFSDPSEPVRIKEVVGSFTRCLLWP